MSTDKRRVIFVGGTAYSGSTFFHLILANDPKGFACGELKASLHPIRPEHVKRDCSCYQPNCSIWPRIVPHGEGKLYSSIFRELPEVCFVVDSSKSPYWIHDQSTILRQQGFEVSNVLIWKTPQEFAQSRKKRNQSSGWAEEWIRYHTLYFSLIDDFVAVQYREITQDRSVLIDTCRQLELPWFDGKEEYWNKIHHSLGGNYSARIHLYQGEKAANFLSGGFDHDRMKRHRSIYYLGNQDPEVEAEVNEGYHARQFHEIGQVLKFYDVSASGDPSASPRIPRFSMPELLVHRARYLTRTTFGKLRFGRAQRAALKAVTSAG